jgi:ABC-type oligopeptide transport system ATPase subunit
MTTPILKVENLTKHFPGQKKGLFGARDVVQAVDGSCR